MELKLNGDQFGLQPPFPFNILLQEHGVENTTTFLEGFLEGFSFCSAVVTWFITDVLAPEKAPYLMADVANFIFDLTGLSAHPEHTNKISQQMAVRSQPTDADRHGPMVKQLNHDHQIIIWYKMVTLYFIWRWIA